MTLNSILIKACVIFLILLAPVLSYSQVKNYAGVVIDSKTGEKLYGASVYIKGAGTGATTNDEGEFAISVAVGNVLAVSFIGYTSEELSITSTTPLQLNIKLEPYVTLGNVTVSTRKKDENVVGTIMGIERLDISEIKLLPTLMGEVDLIKVIQLLPGVQATAEGASGFSVRGGSPDQNLILLDNTIVYNPSHMMGFFSIFNQDVVSGIDLYKGDFPFKFGGRLSSVLDVVTKDEIPSEIIGAGGIGLISSRLTLQCPLGDKTSWIVGGRRSYADLFLKLASNEELKSSTIYFYDFNAKLTHRVSRKDKLSFNAYYGKDKFAAQPGSFNYGNAALSLTWNRIFTKNFFGQFSAHYTNYNYGLGSNLEGTDVYWNSKIRGIMLRADLSQPINDFWNLSYGVSGMRHLFSPGKVTLPQGLDPFVMPNKYAWEYAAYISNEQKLSNRLTLKYGTRFSLFSNDVNYTSLEPGAGLVYKIQNNSSVKANYAHNTQYLQLANNSASGSPLDIWFSASSEIKPQHADLFSVGYFHNLKNNAIEISTELYYKDLKNVIDFADHSVLLLNDNLENEVRTGTGKAYGLEFMLKKNSGKATGFVNYTLSRTERSIPEINKGKTYLAPYDKTHVVNIFLNYNFSQKVHASLAWIFATGNPTTYPTGRFEVEGEYFPIYSGRNEYRRPNYNRLDLSLTYVPNPDSKKRIKGEWNLSIYNAYSKKNPWIIYYNQDKVTRLPYSEMLYLFGIVPSISYNFKF